MTRKIKIAGGRARTVRSMTVKARFVEPRAVAKALGAELVGSGVDMTKATPHIAGLRQRLFGALKSSGGRPSIEGTERRQKIPMSDADWKALEAIAASMASDGIAPAPGQVASQLLHDAIQAHLAGGEPAGGGAWVPAKPDRLEVAEPRASTYQRAGSRKKRTKAAR